MTVEDTYFASAERLDKGDVYLQTIKILGLRSTIQILNLLPNLVAILNLERQVIYANTSFANAIENARFEESLGQRPGELLACVHAQDHIGGCGTGKYCRHCGVVLTILKSQETGLKQQDKANISVKKNGKYVNLDFEVIVSPITVDNEIFYITIYRLLKFYRF